MNTPFFHFQCRKCQARIKAPKELSGQSRPCPGCRQKLVVPQVKPEDSGPILVLLEENDRFSLGIPSRNSAKMPQSKRPYLAPQIA